MSGIDEKPRKVVQREELEDLEERWISKISILDEIRVSERALLEARMQYSEVCADMLIRSTLEALRATQELFQDYQGHRGYWSRLRRWIRRVRDR